MDAGVRGLGLISKGELKSWLGVLALIWGPRLKPPSSLDLTLRRTGGSGSIKARALTHFPGSRPGFRIADSWESQGNPPSTPARVMRPSTCQSGPTPMTSWRWHGRRPLCLLCCLDVSEAGKHPSGYGISVSSGMLSLAAAAQIDTKGGGDVFASVYWEKVERFVCGFWFFFCGTQKIETSSSWVKIEIKPMNSLNVNSVFGITLWK